MLVFITMANEAIMPLLFYDGSSPPNAQNLKRGAAGAVFEEGARRTGAAAPRFGFKSESNFVAKCFARKASVSTSVLHRCEWKFECKRRRMLMLGASDRRRRTCQRFIRSEPLKSRQLWLRTHFVVLLVRRRHKFTSASRYEHEELGESGDACCGMCKCVLCPGSRRECQ